MAEVAVPVDLFNPGQVFACLGLMEAAETLLGEARGGFDWSDPAGSRFHLAAAGPADPVETVLAFLAEAEVVAVAPVGSGLTTIGWKVPTEAPDPSDPLAEIYPFPAPDSPATLASVLRTADGRCLPVDHWGDAGGRDAVKFWAGSGGYPGAGLLRDALDLVRDRLPTAAADPFAVAAVQSSSFRFDWRRDYIPLDVGFSPNAHGDIQMQGYPLVEILAALGLGAARPQRPDRTDKLTYRYAALAGHPGALLPPCLLRAGLGVADLPLPARVFRMRLGWPGQEGQARSIVDVIEEPSR